jgi:8-amino-7-oxononanoate synthase
VSGAASPGAPLLSPAALERAAAGEANANDSARSSSPASPSALRPVTLFSLNDYLGLSSHPDVRRAASSAALSVGMGPRASGVVAGGSTHYHRALERELAQLKKTEDALLFPTGFAANVAVVSALAGLGSGGDGGRVVIFSDELNHASIVDGARLAARGGGGKSGGRGSGDGDDKRSSSNNNVSLRVYRHNDLAHLEELILLETTGQQQQADPKQHAAAQEQQRAAAQQNKNKSKSRLLVVTDSLFSMDGDFADLKGLARLRRKHGFLLLVDDAHATLVCGPTGAGACEMLGLDAQRDVDVQVGTLSKAFGALGGFCACSSELRAFLLNRGRAGVFSTALPVPVVAAASAALGAARREPWRRAHVWALARRLGARLGVPALSPVVPLVVGGEREALLLSARLLARHGLHCPAIRPPTVPAGTCRLRVTLSAAHSAADVDALAAAVEEELARWGDEEEEEEDKEGGGGGGGRARRKGAGPLRLMRLPFLVGQEARMAAEAGQEAAGGVSVVVDKQQHRSRL